MRCSALLQSREERMIGVADSNKESIIMDKLEIPSNEIIPIFDLFFDGTPTSVRLINTSRDDIDFRETAKRREYGHQNKKY